MNRVLAFYYGSHPDDHGRFLADILRQDDTWFEVTHNYVQWLFPLDEVSRVTPTAPLVDHQVVAAFRSDEVLRTHLWASFDRMLRFYGLSREGTAITKGPNWHDRKSNWFIEPTHNNLRITRILKCLTLLHLSSAASMFLASLENLRESERDCGVGATAYSFWRSALHEKVRQQ
ncbi:MAG TPA: opioid growth factor receptor-related protein [Casimicrobiaceae bacterium]|nr:opioid growth factor receptor-related protein [Casimicrobiaceae bacterium]